MDERAEEHKPFVLEDAWRDWKDSDPHMLAVKALRSGDADVGDTSFEDLILQTPGNRKESTRSEVGLPKASRMTSTENAQQG